MSIASLIRVIVVALVLCLAGCGSSQAFHVSNDFTADERAALTAAVADMEARTGGEPIELVFDGDTSAHDRIVRAQPPSGPDAEGQIVEHSAPVGASFGESPTKTIYLAPGLDPSRFYDVARHELGHFYGLGHHDAPGLMHPDANAEWSEADVAVCQAAGLCQ